MSGSRRELIGRMLRTWEQGTFPRPPAHSQNRDFLVVGREVSAIALSGEFPPCPFQPSQYVKVCSLYGGILLHARHRYVHQDRWLGAVGTTYGTNGNSTTGSFASDYNNRYTNNFWTRERGYITVDAREQTAYGVARGYLNAGISSQNQGNECRPLRPARTVPSCSGRASRPVCRCRSSTSIRQPRCSTAPATCRRRFRRRRLVGVGLHRPVRRRLLRHAVG